MHQRAQPYPHTMRPAELLLPDERMDATVPVAEIVARELPPEMVFLDPVELEVAERFAVPAADDGETMLAVQRAAQEGFLLGARAAFAPHGVDAGVVHPGVQEVGVAGIDGHVGDRREAAVRDARIGRKEGRDGVGDWAAVCGRFVGERCDPEGEVLAHAGNEARVECFALGGGLLAEGVPDVVGEGEEGGRGRVICWEVAARGEWPG